jgi:Zn finger protein HypA/HybF involved in hydrogenase expression
MHEFSVMSQIVSSILEEARKRDAIKVEEVVL